MLFSVPNITRTISLPNLICQYAVLDMTLHNTYTEDLLVHFNVKQMPAEAATLP
jgi:hypothetical protein